jgi:hypothetical protein
MTASSQVSSISWAVQGCRADRALCPCPPMNGNSQRFRSISGVILLHGNGDRALTLAFTICLIIWVSGFLTRVCIGIFHRLSQGRPDVECCRLDGWRETR